MVDASHDGVNSEGNYYEDIEALLNVSENLKSVLKSSLQVPEERSNLTVFETLMGKMADDILTFSKARFPFHIFQKWFQGTSSSFMQEYT